MAYEVDGAKHLSIPETAKRWGKSVSFVKARIKAGMVPFALAKPKHGALNNIPVIRADQPCPAHDPEKKKWLNRTGPVKHVEPESVQEGTFPALHRNDAGEVAPSIIDREAEAVSCSDCPHCVDKTRKCYGLSRYDNAETGEGFYGCHRIGRKVLPMKEWTRKSDFAPTPTGVEERKNEVPSVLITEPKQITATEPEPVETTLPVPEDGNEAVFREAIVRLEALASEMKAEAEELEARFEHLSEQLNEIIKAKEALERIREYGRR